jgi:hypothetical protein
VRLALALSRAQLQNSLATAERGRAGRAIEAVRAGVDGPPCMRRIARTCCATCALGAADAAGRAAVTGGRAAAAAGRGPPIAIMSLPAALSPTGGGIPIWICADSRRERPRPSWA